MRTFIRMTKERRNLVCTQTGARLNLADAKSQLSVDLDHPYRLIFTPAHDPVPRLEDGGLDWSQVTAITILGVEDTHE